MSELDLTLGGEDFHMTRENTSLFTFLGEAAIYNHIFFEHKREQRKLIGTYLFAANPAYVQLKEFIEEHSYPQHINMLEAAQCDVDAWNSHYLNDLNDISSVPEEWENGNR